MEKKEIPVTDGDQQEELAHEENTPVDQQEEHSAEEVLEAAEEEQLEETSEKSKVEEGIAQDDMKHLSNEKLAAELSEMKDKYLRLYAEFDNYRRRTMREKENLIKTASESTLLALLPSIDDFSRAIKLADQEDNEETIPEGLRLVYQKMMKALEQRGLKVMESTGEVFNPDMHEALTKVPVQDETMKGKVIDTVERGYYLHDKIIRYAKVVVGQ